MDDPVYLDHQATTPMDPRAVAAMLPYFSEVFGNPHATHYSLGAAADEAVARARGQIAALIGADPAEVVFTSGATEANNLALRGVAGALRRAGKTHVIISAIEHSCTLAIASHLEEQGFELTRLEVDASGVIAIGTLAGALRAETGLVSIMAANNEIGTLQPIGDIGRLCSASGVLFHTDAAQAAGKIPLDVRTLHVDLMSLSAHKLYGPKGVGALYVRSRLPIRLEPLILGGGQERGMRAGTLATPLCVGFGEACWIAATESENEAERLAGLRAGFLALLQRAGISYVINGSMEHRLAGNLNLSFPGVDAEALLMTLRDRVAISTGSACTTGRLEPSHVLRAIGLSDSLAEAAVRVGFGRFTTTEDVDRAAHAIVASVTRLSRLSYQAPIYADA